MRLGVSECLMGVTCRYDGGHARDGFVTDVLKDFMEMTPFCPEAAVLGTPRESMRFVRGKTGAVRLLGNATGTDHTEALERCIDGMVAAMAPLGLCGFVFKAKSPSCGIERVKIYTEAGMPADGTDGLFARAVKRAYPHLPVEDEKRLLDPWLRENFMIRIFAYERWQTLMAKGCSMGELVDFHSRHKFLLQSKNETLYRQLGQIVANHDKKSLPEVLAAYGESYLTAIAALNSRGAAVNVLEHMYGFVKKLLSKEETAHFKKSLAEFQDGIIPMIAVLKLLEHYIVQHDVAYLKGQLFLEPYPAKLGLRSSVEAYR